MHSFNSCLVHCVWSTKNRGSLLDSNLRERLWPYLGGIARENIPSAEALGYFQGTLDVSPQIGGRCLCQSVLCS